MFGNVKLRNRMLLGYSIPVVLMLSIGGIVYSTANQISQAFRQADLSKSALLGTDIIVIGASKMERSTRGYILTRNDSFLDMQKEGYKLAQEGGKAAEEMIENSDQKAKFKKLMEFVNELNRSNIQLINSTRNGKQQEAIKLFSSFKDRDITQEIENLNDEFNTKETMIMEAATKKAQSAINFLIVATILGTLFAMAIAITAAFLISSSIAQKINQAVSAIASSASEIAATTEQQERTVAHQAISVNQTTTTMDELSASSRQAASQATVAAESARQVLNLAESSAAGANEVLMLAESSAQAARQVLNLVEGGNKTVAETLEGMASLKEKVAEIAQQIMRLSEQANQIGSITSVVTDLANQTNMLALNAAVEAVRAGENGKGFAVVAAEIRKLADQSKKSADKINTLIYEIDHAISATVMVTDEGRKSADESIKISARTAEAFTSVAQGINDVVLQSSAGVVKAINDIVLSNQETALTALNDVVVSSNQISLSAQQQAVAIQQVVEAMNALNQGASQTASAISQTKVGSQKLNEAAQNLKSIV